MQPGLATNLCQFSCLCLLSAKVTGIQYHAQLYFIGFCLIVCLFILEGLGWDLFIIVWADGDWIWFGSVFYFVWFWFWFWDRASLYGPSWPGTGTHSTRLVDQADLESSTCLWLLSTGTKGMHHYHTRLLFVFISKKETDITSHLLSVERFK